MYHLGSPKSDTCSKCDESTGDQAHLQRAQLAYDAQMEDKEEAWNKQVHYLTFDLEKPLPFPKLTSSVALYLHQFWLYNLGLHYILNGNTEKATFNN